MSEFRPVLTTSGLLERLRQQLTQVQLDRVQSFYPQFLFDSVNDIATAYVRKPLITSTHSEKYFL
jgi:hypothetical protein